MKLDSRTLSPRSPLCGVWVRKVSGVDVTLHRIGMEFSATLGAGVAAEYSGPLINHFGPITDEAEVFLIDRDGVLRAHGPALVDMTWSAWGVTGHIRSSGRWEIL